MKFNGEMANLIYQHYLGNNFTKFQCVLIQGGEISADELRTNFLTSAVQPFLGNFVSLYNTVNTRGGKVVGVIDLPRVANPVIGSSINFQAMFQTSNSPVNVLNSGTPDWFLLYSRVTNVLYNQNGNSVFCMRGTISDLDGVGDMIVNDPEMVIGKSYTVLNIKFRQKVHNV